MYCIHRPARVPVYLGYVLQSIPASRGAAALVLPPPAVAAVGALRYGAELRLRRCLCGAAIAHIAFLAGCAGWYGVG
eukprot:365400-Chlamydomonas_euryale.AAC.2